MSERSDSDSTAPSLEINHTVLFLADVLTSIPIRHALIGGQAYNAWAKTRATDDYDFCVEATRDRVELLEQRLIEHGLGYRRRQDEKGPSGPDFIQMANQASTLIVDLQTAKTEFQETVIARAKETSIGLRVATPEDLVVLKLLAMRSQDQRDIALLIEWNELDWDYIHHWAEIWQVEDALKVFKP